MRRVVHFEIPADDPEKAVAFYAEVFGWRFQKWDGPQDYWLVTTGEPDEPGIDGGLMRRPKDPGAGTVNVIDVPSVREFLRKIEENGGATVVPTMGIPGVGWLAYCKDPDGNVFGIMETDEAAA